MQCIYLTKGYRTIVDDATFAYFGSLNWHASEQRGNVYAVRNLPLLNGRRGTLTLHHAIMGVPLFGGNVDHIDGNGLNNQKANLSVVTHRNNLQNTHKHREGKLPGTYRMKDHYHLHKPWKAFAWIGSKQKTIGYFSTELEAHEAYLNALRRSSLM